MIVRDYLLMGLCLIAYKITIEPVLLKFICPGLKLKSDHTMADFRNWLNKEIPLTGRIIGIAVFSTFSLFLWPVGLMGSAVALMYALANIGKDNV